MEHDLDAHISLQRSLFAARHVNFVSHLDRLHQAQVADEQARVEITDAKIEIQAMLAELLDQRGEMPQQQALMRQTLHARLSGLLPNDTPADVVERFMARTTRTNDCA